jgi:hypothetical protein
VAETGALLRGCIDVASRREISGWAFDPENPGAAVPLEIAIDSRVVMLLRANQYRADLAGLGIGDGRHGFRAAFSGLPVFRRHVIEVRRAYRPEQRIGRPVVLEPEPGFDGQVRSDLEQLVRDRIRGASSPAELEPVIALLAQKVDTLLGGGGGRFTLKKADK